jgi:dsDNA-specific endonuclease/ATPase MutS2
MSEEENRILEMREEFERFYNVQRALLGELEDVLDSLEERLRDEDVLEYRLFLNAIQKAKEEYNKEGQ